MLGALQQAYLKNLTAQAAGGGGSPDVFTPMLKKLTTQGMQAEAEGD